MYKQYIDKVSPIIKSYGGKYLVRGGQTITFAGDWKPQRIIIIEFRSLDDLKKCFKSVEYKQIAHLRENSTKSRVIISQGADEV